MKSILGVQPFRVPFLLQYIAVTLFIRGTLAVPLNLGETNTLVVDLSLVSTGTELDFSSIDSDWDIDHTAHLVPLTPSYLVCSPNAPCRLPPSSSDSDIAIRGSGHMTVHRRGKPGEAAQKAGKGMKTAAKVLGQVAQAANEIPEVGPLIAAAVKVIEVLLKILGGIIEELGKLEAEAAKHEHLFQGDEHHDWSHRTTHVNTVKGSYTYEVYTARAGVFVNYGDGGWENWAYVPSWQSDHKLVASGWQNHTLQYTGGAPQNRPKHGQCSLHIFEDQPTKRLIVIVKDDAGVIIGFTTNADPTSKAGVQVHSQLTGVVSITADKTDKLTFHAPEDTWTTDRCGTRGDYKNKSRQLDCKFKCTKFTAPHH
ncbi:hypothetical protein BDP27DRAFT_1448516 [Rhodocollybia butyracea]|uniref:Uncharacterized protein n=1 Tax=Rhodocollybia butyracea TaxID=206335 RepID=A0A9P5U6T5_9AGAR|nr:hypothetical protein BDP27DRAFT_1448516 [Rhodocollybia butyracea]